jgi:hypothetical protein
MIIILLGQAMILRLKIISALLACAPFFAGCSGLDKAAQSTVHTRPKVSVQTALARAVAALKEYRDIDDWAGRYELRIRRHEDHWTVDFIDVPPAASVVSQK